MRRKAGRKKDAIPRATPTPPPKATPNPNAPCEWSGRKCTVHSLIAGQFVVARVPRRKSGRLFSEWTLGSPSPPVPGFKSAIAMSVHGAKEKEMDGEVECDSQREGNCSVRTKKKKTKKLQDADTRDEARDECTVRVELRVRRNERVHGASEHEEPNALGKGNKSTVHARRVMNGQCR
ncbi:unnamed protein product [Bursaphelenchus xylophilus]|uniref:(pine wood nematode) hypothetical protein n=1 Tax=Bursaphelenchus xylophilus TaxID=6326 RepID=A0A1I7RLQ0_BURXY|nr:unnamed protein product [Bursaphelenchus xylophilus]CAG9082716.1 unnamed protein product [Bursaphelenchus xylophilus]